MSETTNDNSSPVAVSAQDIPSEATTTVATQAGSEAPTTSSAADGTSTPVEKKLILDKFESQDDLIKSYQELESKQPEVAKYKKSAELLEKLAEQNGTSIDEVERQIQETLEKQEMEAAGVNDPVVFRMQKKLEALEAESKKNAFENEFGQLQQQFPVLASVKDAIKQTYLTSNGRTLGQIVNTMYAPVIAQVEQQAVQKLSEKEAANALAPQGNVQHAVTEQELTTLRKEAERTRSTDAIARYTAAKKRFKK